MDDIHIQARRLSKIDPMGGFASSHPSTTPTITRARPSTYGSYSMTPAHTPTSLWARDIRYSQFNYKHDPVVVCSLPSTPFDNTFLSLGNPTNLSLIERYNNWETPSLKEKCCSSDNLLKNCRKPAKKWSMPMPQSDMCSKSKYWPPVLLPPPAKQWTPLPSASDKRGLTEPSTHFCFARPFGMLETTKQWSTQETTSTASYRQEDDRRRRPHPVRVLHLPTSLDSWRDSTTRLCGMCTTSPSSRTEGTTTGTTSEVAVFMP